MKKILVLFLAIMIFASFTVGVSANTKTTPSFQVEYKELGDGNVEVKVYVIGNVAVKFTGYVAAIAWDDELVNLADISYNKLITDVVKATVDGAISNSLNTTITDPTDSSSINTSTWTNQSDGSKLASNNIIFGYKDGDSAAANSPKLLTTTKLEVAQLYFKLADSVTTLKDEEPFSSYVYTAMPKKHSQINYNDGAAKTVYSGNSNPIDSTLLNFVDITERSSTDPEIYEGTFGGFGDNIGANNVVTGDLTISGTAKNFDANSEFGIKFGTEVSETKGTYFPALSAVSEGVGTLMQNGKYAIILEKLDELAVKGSFQIGTYFINGSDAEVVDNVINIEIQ